MSSCVCSLPIHTLFVSPTLGVLLFRFSFVAVLTRFKQAHSVLSTHWVESDERFVVANRTGNTIIALAKKQHLLNIQCVLATVWHAANYSAIVINPFLLIIILSKFQQVKAHQIS